VDMKHESIVVVYDSCQAIAEEIADRLGAEIVSVQSVNARHVENSQSFVLALEFQADGLLTPHWQYACQTFKGTSLSGKHVAMFVALGNSIDHAAAAESVRKALKACGAHVVGQPAFVSSPQWNTDNWACIVSPNL